MQSSLPAAGCPGKRPCPPLPGMPGDASPYPTRAPPTTPPAWPRTGAGVCFVKGNYPHQGKRSPPCSHPTEPPCACHGANAVPAPGRCPQSRETMGSQLPASQIRAPAPFWGWGGTQRGGLSPSGAVTLRTWGPQIRQRDPRRLEGDPGVLGWMRPQGEVPDGSSAGTPGFTAQHCREPRGGGQQGECPPPREGGHPPPPSPIPFGWGRKAEVGGGHFWGAAPEPRAPPEPRSPTFLDGEGGAQSPQHTPEPPSLTSAPPPLLQAPRRSGASSTRPGCA